ncbi:ATP-binding protein [Rhodococcus erythropolis]|uniref:ATP-binding protein n=1 Tax=Rhodococcus erythropolis TaxID=1833 RepID=UPI00366BC98B
MADTDSLKDIEHYTQALKAPRIRESAARLAEQARSDAWSHEDYLAAVLSREVTARQSSGSQTRIRSAGFPTRKSLEEFNFDYSPSLSRETVSHLGTGVFLTQAYKPQPSGAANSRLGFTNFVGGRLLRLRSITYPARR